MTTSVIVARYGSDGICHSVALNVLPGSGVTCAAFDDAAEAAQWASRAHEWRSQAVVEFAPEECKPALDLWPSPGPELDTMRRVKTYFDPRDLLNRGRLYGRI